MLKKNWEWTIDTELENSGFDLHLYKWNVMTQQRLGGSLGG